MAMFDADVVARREERIRSLLLRTAPRDSRRSRLVPASPWSICSVQSLGLAGPKDLGDRKGGTHR